MNSYVKTTFSNEYSWSQPFAYLKMQFNLNEYSTLTQDNLVAWM